MNFPVKKELHRCAYRVVICTDNFTIKILCYVLPYCSIIHVRVFHVENTKKQDALSTSVMGYCTSH